MRRLKEKEGLRRQAKKLGVSLEQLPGKPEPPITILNDPEIQRRVMEAQRHKREGSLWLLALLSAIASIVSAVAAWYAIAHKT
jgi:hypothetical protein